MRGLLALFGCLFAAAAFAGPAIHLYQLDNGLKLIVKEDHRAPVMVSQVWYKVGSSYEHDGITGLSHVLEHMMFKGTAAHPAGEFSRIIAASGGQENAFTSRDYTAYFQTMEASRLPLSFELEADRMRNLSLPEDEFKKEVQVVMEERRMRTDDNPQSLTSSSTPRLMPAARTGSRLLAGWVTCKPWWSMIYETGTGDGTHPITP
jgi:zinc protease